MTGARKAVTPVSAEILREALQFPDDVQVIGEEDGNVHMLVSSERIPEGADAVLAVWVKKGETVEFLKFDPINMPAFIRPAIAERRGNLCGGGDAALAIGEDAFRAGWAAHAAVVSFAASGDRSGLPEAVTTVEQAWSNYEPPEDIKELV